MSSLRASRAAATALSAALCAAPCLAAFDPFEAGVPFVRVYDVAGGLPQNTVHALLVDREGALWAGTQDGVARYDGNSWSDLELPTRDRSSFVRALLESSDGALWIGTQSAGLLRRTGDAWTMFGLEGPGPGDRRVNALAETRSGGGHQVWVATHDAGLARFDGREWKTFRVADGLPADRVWELLPIEDSGEARLWVATEGGPAILHLPDGPIEVPAGAPKDSASSLERFPAGSGRSEQIWVGLYGGGLARYSDGAWQRFDAASGLPSQFVTDLARAADRPGTLWIATDGGGLALLDGESVRQIELGPGFSSRAVYKILETGAEQGASALWIGTRNNGLLRLTGGYWRSFVPFPEIPLSPISALLVREDGEGGEELWLGTDGYGVAVLRRGRWERYSRAGAALGNDTVFALTESRHVGERPAVWVGTRNGGVSRWDGGGWRRFDRAGGDLPNDLVQTLLETVDANGRGRLWVGTREGLASFDGESWRTPDPAEGWPTSSVLALLEERDAAGRATLWIGTSTGLYRWRDGAIRQWSEPEGLLNASVQALHLRRGASGRRELWIGTDGGGASVLDPDDEAARVRPLADLGVPRLPNQVVYAILEDRSGALYLPTNRGVVRLRMGTRAPGAAEPEAAEVELQTIEHGLPSSQTSRGAAAVDGRGRVWVGTVTGAAAIDPALEPEDRTAKRILVDATFTDGSGRRLAPGQSVQHGEDRLLFTYRLLSYFGEPMTRYRTQLAGHEATPTAWTAAGEREFAGVPPGSYVFRVWGRDANGRVSGPEEIAFTVQPAPWQTWWARVGFSGVLVLGVFGLVRARQNRHERRERELEDLVVARTARLQRANALLIELSYVDAVTSIPNRRRFDELLSAEWKRAVRGHTPLALVMIDIDRFKRFNDSYGHQRGDDCLRQVAAALADALSRSGDAIARYGGEEFALILPATDVEGALRVAEQLRRRVEALAIPNAASDIAPVVTVSCGVAASSPEMGGDVEQLLLAADRALYSAKGAGRNRVSAES